MNTNIDGRRKVAFALTAIKVYFLFTEADHTIGTLDVLKADVGQSQSAVYRLCSLSCTDTTVWFTACYSIC